MHNVSGYRPPTTGQSSELGKTPTQQGGQTSAARRPLPPFTRGSATAPKGGGQNSPIQERQRAKATGEALSWAQTTALVATLKQAFEEAKSGPLTPRPGVTSRRPPAPSRPPPPAPTSPPKTAVKGAAQTASGQKIKFSSLKDYERKIILNMAESITKTLFPKQLVTDTQIEKIGNYIHDTTLFDRIYDQDIKNPSNNPISYSIKTVVTPDEKKAIQQLLE